jgi:SAM-dependent methyltransferase
MLLRLVGDVAGQAVIDLACGEGHYTRALRQQGAARVVGVDLSRAMIGLAEAEEARRPLGVEYRVGDVRALDVAGEFDLAFAAYLLNYARTAEELTQMCRGVARALRPGGRFVTVNSNPAEPTVAFPAAGAYGFSRRVEGELVEGAPVVLEFFLPEGSFEVTNYYLSPATMEEAFRAAGLRDLRWHAPEVSPEGLREFGRGYWADFLAHPPVAFIECVK